MNDKPTIILKDPIETQISKRLTNMEAKEILNTLVSFCRKYDVEVSEMSDPALAKAFRTLTESNKGVPIVSLREIYEAFCSNPDNIIALTNYYPKYRAVWEHILSHTTISQEDINKIFGREVRICNVKIGWERLMVSEAIFFPLFPMTRYQSYYSFTLPKFKYFYIEPHLRRELTLYLLGDELVTPHFVDTLPTDKALKVASFEERLTSTELFSLQGIAMGGYILKQTGMVMVPRMRKIIESKTFQPFNFGDRLLNRAELVTMLYFMCQGYKQQNLTIRRLVKYIITEFPRNIMGTQFAAFLPHLYGFTKSMSETAFFSELTEIVNSLIKQADGKWLSLANFPTLALSTSVGRLNSPVIFSFMTDDNINESIHREVDRNRRYDYYNPGKNISPIDEIGMPLAMNWIQTLCGLGMLEIAYDPTVDPDNEPQNGMRFIRLTPLGRFAFGLTAQYTPLKSDNPALIDYDSENSIITDLTPNSPYSMLLSKITTPIGHNRYLLSARSIAHDCKTAKEVDDRRTMIEQLVTPETMKAMTPAFQEAHSRLNCGQIDQGYALLSIRPELDELRQLLAHNPKTKKIVQQLNRNTFLIKHSDLPLLNNILAAEGYKL